MAGKFFPIPSCGKAIVICIFWFWLKLQETKLETDAKGDCNLVWANPGYCTTQQHYYCKAHLAFFSPLPEGEVHWKICCVPLSNTRRFFLQVVLISEILTNNSSVALLSLQSPNTLETRIWKLHD